MTLPQHILKPFDPAAGTSIVAPPGQGHGWWAGAAAAAVDPASGGVYLSYRIRKPRGEPDDRGGRCIIAWSQDGESFHEAWTMTKANLDSPSLERSDLFLLPGGAWAMYISYVDGATNAWRTDMMVADRPEHLNPADRRPVFLPEALGLAAVKDPVVTAHDGRLWMLLSMASPRPGGPDADHSTADAYDTGTILSHTGLASSRDGLRWHWEGTVLPALDNGAWDGYSARISGLLQHSDRWIGYYDGAHGVANHYDETTGVVSSPDLRRWERHTPDGPTLQAPGGACLRYMDVIQLGHELLFYYEYGRPDGSHELRLNRTPLPPLDVPVVPADRLF